MFSSGQRAALKRQGRSSLPWRRRVRRDSYRPLVEQLEQRLLLNASNLGFVSQAYQDLLAHAPDAGGLAFWGSLLDQGAGRFEVVQGIENGYEFRARQVQGWFAKLLDRPAEPAAVNLGVAFLAAGGTMEQLEATILGSPEYFLQHGQGSTTGFLAAAYHDVLGRAMDPSGAQAFSQAMAAGATPAGVAAILVNSLEARIDQVQGLYLRYFGRPADAGGLNFFVNALYHQADQDLIVANLLASTEYDARVGTVTPPHTQPPVITILSPSGSPTLNQNLSVMGRVTNGQSGVASLQAAVDGGAFTSVSFDGSGNFHFDTTLALDGKADGNHAVHFQARDGAGDLANTTVNFTLDTMAPTLSLTAPLDGARTSNTVRLLGAAADTGSGVANVQFALDGAAFGSLPVDTSGHFDQALASSSLPVGTHQVLVKATDAAGNTTQQTVSFNVTSDFLVGGAGTKGWGEATTDTIRLEERDSLVVQTSVPVQLGPTKGSRTLRFQVAPQFDTTDKTSASGDRFLVYLVDPAHPTQTLLDSGQPGTALFTLSKGTAAEFPAGLVRDDGTTVQIDATGLTTATSGLLVFQLINSDRDTGSAVQIQNLSDTVDANGTASPVFTASTIAAGAAGPALDLSTLSAVATAKVRLTNVRLDPAAGSYTAQISVENDGSALGRTLAVVFPGLPSGVMLENPSGTDATGAPYLNLHDALLPGGLTTGAVSMPIQVTFDDPNLLRFNLKPTILSSGPNQAPTLSAIMPLTVSPGGRLEVQLQGADADGDPLAYSLRSSGTLPNMTLKTTGLLVIQPAPGQLGSYSFTAVVSDGALEATQTVSLNVVADPVTTTRVSGLLMDVHQTPLAGVRMAIGSLQTTTAADGSFLLESPSGPLPGDALSVYANELTGSVSYPFVAEKLALLLGHDVYTGVNNVIGRPIFLPLLDTAHGTMVNPAAMTKVAPATIPGASLMIAPHTLKTPQGTDFNGLASITQVPSTLTPAALPPDLKPSMVVTIQPGGMNFTTPAPLTLPNAGFAPGTMMNLWSINPVTGFFDIAGTGQVSADGSVINTVTGGIHNSSWHFFAPLQAALSAFGLDPYTFDNFCIPCDLIELFSSNVESHSGAVVEEHALPTYQSLGADHGVNLVYDSLRADPRPIVHATYNDVDPSFYSVPSALRLVAKLSVNRCPTDGN
jgi:hypothetical protein